MSSNIKFNKMIKEVETKFGFQPYIYLSDPNDYINKKSKVKLKCKKCGYEFEYQPGEILRPRIKKPVCKNCTLQEETEKKRERGKKEFFEKLEKFYPNVYTYDKEEFINVKTNMNFTCNKCNTTFSIKPNNILNNIRERRDYYCKTCSFKKISENMKQNSNFETKLNEKFPEMYSIIEYNGYDNDCKVKCMKCAEEFNIIADKLLNSKNFYCPKCSPSFKHDTRDYLTRCFEETSGRIIPIQKFKDSKTEILHKCTKCDHEWLAKPNNIVINHTSCPECSKSYIISNGELELRNYINEIYSGPILYNDRTTIAPKELDIFIPELKLGIEYCGLYWHNEKHKGKKYHLEKLEMCNNQGIRLITIFEDEWLYNKKLVKDKIKHIMQLDNKEKIYARKCYVKVIKKPECDRLLNDNHLQGADRASIRLGLFYNKKLVAAMTFCKPRVSTGSVKSKENIDYELSRFVTDIDYNVIGSFGKLFNYFKNKYEWNCIITYADLRWSNGDVYFKNNFTNTHDSKPNYFYVERNDGTRRIHRFMYRKSAIKNKHPEVYDKNLTEREMTEKLNLYRIYDCGNKVFIFKR